MDLPLPDLLEEKRQKWVAFSDRHRKLRGQAQEADDFAYEDQAVQMAESFLHDLWDLAKDHLD